jgi:hypothetical protein
MSSVIIGQYPIINKQLSSIDDNGIQNISYFFTVKTEDIYKYLPAKDTEYYGPNGETASQSPFFDPNPANTSLKTPYVVMNVDVQSMDGGLSEIMVKTIGTQNTLSRPKVRIIPNYPLIFGLAGMKQQNGQIGGIYEGSGNPVAGVAVEVTFITPADFVYEGEAYDKYYGKIMPASIYGTNLPLPMKQPFTQGNYATEGTGRLWQSGYDGFYNKEMSHERMGSVSLFRLIYSEVGGFAYDAAYRPSSLLPPTWIYKYNYTKIL